MLRASIFQKNIIQNSEKSEKALSFNNCLVDISDTNLNILSDNKIILSSKLKKIESDFNTTSYLGYFSDGSEFRIIRPNDAPLENLREEFNCISAFSIASINPDGYAIHFILTEKDDIRNNESIAKGSEEQIQRLLDGCLLALNNEMHQSFIDLSKRILELIDNGNTLLSYNFGPETLEIIKNNLEYYTLVERQKIN